MIPATVKEVIRDFVFGMEDGLVSNLGLVLGVYVGGGDAFTIILAGFASMFTGAFSMSAGSYLSSKSQREVYEQEIESTKENLLQNPRKCYTEMRSSLIKEGLSKTEVDRLLKTSSRYKHPQFVCNYMVQKKVGISKEKLETPLKNAFTMFFSFLVGSAFPIFPFLVSKFDSISLSQAAVIASTLTIVALFGVGWAKTTYTKLSWFKSGVEVVLIGLAAGVIGYLVGWAVGYLA
ncbi:VIT1/CCC1 transporter family protein [Candidatus Falkowbacteria bacterium]|nr:VIT1/CCC1 transporter family protein [Candidatus Falkowbacteria bacterium]